MSTDVFPDCDEDYIVKTWQVTEDDKWQQLEIFDSYESPSWYGDLRRFPLGTIFICMEREL
jgi:hypothetical protein